MSNDSKNLEKLIVGYLEDTASDDDLREFYSLLEASSDAREVYSQHAALHGVLTWMHYQRVCDNDPQTTARVTLADNTSHGNSMKRWSLPLAVLAASLAILLFSTWAPWGESPSQVAKPDTSEVPANTEKTALFADGAIARILRKVDCDWEGDRWSVVSSSQLLPGQTLKMARGLMELEFISGAQVKDANAWDPGPREAHRNDPGICPRIHDQHANR